MKSPRILIVCTLLAGGTFIAPTVPVLRGQGETSTQVDHPTAAQLYESGMKRYAQGDYQAALETLRRVDPLQLPKAQRVSLYKTIQDIDRQIQRGAGEAPANAQAATPAAPTPEQLLAEAAQARSLGKTDQAVDLYEQALRHDDAGAGTIARAKAQLAQIERSRKMDVTAARRLLDEIDQDLAANRLDDAQRKVQSIRDSDVKLGFFDRERLNRKVAVLAERQAESGRTQPIAAQVSEEAPASGPQADQAREVSRTIAPTSEPNSSQTAEAPAPAPAPAQPQAPRQAAPAQASASTSQSTTGQANADSAQPITGRQAATPQPASTQPAAAPAPAVQARDADWLAQVRKIRAQERITQAQQAQEQGQYNLAANLYEQALQLDPNNEQVQNALASVRSMRQPSGILEREQEVRQLRREQTTTEYAQLKQQAQRQASRGNYDAAVDSIQQAKVTLDRNRAYLPTAEYNRLRAEAVDLAIDIEDRARDARAARIADQERQQEIEAQRRRDEAVQQRQQEVERLVRRAIDLRKERKYDQALDQLEQALFIDPNNVPAQALKMGIEDSRVQLNARTHLRTRALEITRQAVDNIEATIPYNEILNFPPDWPELTAQRLGGLEGVGGESEETRQTWAKLKEVISVPFEDAAFEQVITFFENVTGLNFFVNWGALETVGLQRDQPITLLLNNVPAENALKLVLQQASGAVGNDFNPVKFDVVEGVVTISTQDDLTENRVIRSYDIRDMLVQIRNFDNAPEFDLDSVLEGGQEFGGGQGGGGGGSSQSLFGGSGTGQDQDDEPPTRDELILEITALIQDTVGNPEDWQTFGGDDSIREFNGQLIVKTTPDKHRQMTALLDRLREIRAIQISVEARFLLVDQNFLDEVGFDLDMQITGLAEELGPIQIAQDSFGLTQRSSTGLPGSFTPSTNPGIGLPPGQDLDGDGTIDTEPSIAPGGFQPSGRSLDVGINFIDDLQLNLLIRATQANRRSIALTAPKLTFFNGQRAFVTIARQVAFVSDLEPIPNSVGFDPTLSVTQSGAQLQVQGTVSADRRYVTLEVIPALATLIQPIRQISQSSAVLADVGGGAADEDEVVTGSAFVEAPEVEVTQVRTTVSVPDRGTLLLGGQRLVAEIEVEAGVPILSKVPLLNRLTTNRTTQKDERTLLILIRPTIIIQSEQEEMLYPGLLDDPGRFSNARSFGP